MYFELLKTFQFRLKNMCSKIIRNDVTSKFNVGACHFNTSAINFNDFFFPFKPNKGEVV